MFTFEFDPVSVPLCLHDFTFVRCRGFITQNHSTPLTAPKHEKQQPKQLYETRIGISMDQFYLLDEFYNMTTCHDKGNFLSLLENYTDLHDIVSSERSSKVDIWFPRNKTSDLIACSCNIFLVK